MPVLILHGIGGHAGIHWQQWLHDQLTQKGHTVIMPNLLQPDHPIRKNWLRAIQNLTKDIKLDDLIIVGHSLGVTSALDFIENTPTKVKGLVSVSGFSDDYQAELNSYFLRERIINFKKIKQNLNKSFVLYGNNDPYVPQNILKSLAIKLDIIPTIIPNGGHLNTDSGFTTFPQLLEIIEKIN